MKPLLKTLIAFTLATAFLLTGCGTTDVSSDISSTQEVFIDASQVADDVLQMVISLGGELAPDFKGVDALTCKNLCLYYLRWCRVSGVDLNSVWEEQPNGSLSLKKEAVDQFAVQYFYGYNTEKFSENEYLYLPPTLPAVDSKNCAILSFSLNENIVTIRIESTFDLPSDLNTDTQRTSTATITATIDNGTVKIISSVAD